MHIQVINLLLIYLLINELINYSPFNFRTLLIYDSIIFSKLLNNMFDPDIFLFL